MSEKGHAALVFDKYYNDNQVSNDLTLVNLVADLRKAWGVTKVYRSMYSLDLDLYMDMRFVAACMGRSCVPVLI